MIKLYKICTDILSPKYYAMFERIQAILIFYCYVDLMCKLNYSNIHSYIGLKRYQCYIAVCM